MFLHAWKMHFPHPINAETLALEAPLPEILSRFMQIISQREQQDYGEKI
jgi:23S rRNA pseudouridine955/2504/2580 synthase